MKKIKTYKVFNESLKDKLKGKSKKEVLDNIKDLSIQDKFERAIEYDLPDLDLDLIY